MLTNHTYRLTTEAKELLTKLRGDYDIYTLCTPYVSATLLNEYYLPRLVQVSAKGRRVTRDELQETIYHQLVSNIPYYTELDEVTHLTRDAAYIVRTLVTLISMLKTPTNETAQVIQHSTHPDLGYVLHISDSIHYTTCLSTGLVGEVTDKHDDVRDTDEYLDTVQQLSRKYLSNSRVPTMATCEKYSGYRGCNAAYLKPELGAYEQGYICYVVVGNPIHIDGKGYKARVRLHALVNTESNERYWLLDTMYGDSKYFKLLLQAALDFAEEGHLLSSELRSHVTIDGVEYVSPLTYKDNTASLQDAGDELYVVRRGHSQSASINQLLKYKKTLQYLRQDYDCSYAHFIKFYNDAPYFCTDSVKLKNLGVQKVRTLCRQDQYKPTSSRQAIINLPVIARDRNLRKLVVPLINKYAGLPVYRQSRESITWPLVREGVSSNIQLPYKCTVQFDESVLLAELLKHSDDRVSINYMYLYTWTAPQQPNVHKSIVALSQKLFVSPDNLCVALHFRESFEVEGEVHTIVYRMYFKLTDLASGVMEPCHIVLKESSHPDKTNPLLHITSPESWYDWIRQTYVHNMP